MTEEEFWLHLEHRITHELDGFAQWRRDGLWCDGIYPQEYELDAIPQMIAGVAWIGFGRSRTQEQWSFQLIMQRWVARREEIDWQSVLPPEHVTQWLGVERGQRRLRIDPGSAVPDEV